jgi:hypothetical protein
MRAVLLALFLVGCGDTAYVQADHITLVQAACAPNGGLREVRSSWCHGKGCTPSNAWTITGYCMNGLRFEKTITEGR